MKVKELDKTVNLAWSPSQQHPLLLAAGTAAQQLDASFSTSATLELYALNLNDPGLDLALQASTPSQNRFHNIAWGGWGCGRDGQNGIIVGGCEGGRLQIYSASKLLGGEESLIVSQERHTGPVRSIDFNAFQTNLLATGASESEIFIWDLNNTSTPMTPGAKSQPLEDVVWLSWNKQVQHILASTFATRCIVWDLRKNEPIIKLTDTNSRVRWKVVAWHPDIATQLCLASEEDTNPVIQLWDLRFATTPIKTFEGHQKGVMSIAWCAQDPDLLISCGKDNKILCWNPNTAEQGQEVVCELVSSNQFNFEVTWCPRNPNLVATSSFDGHASVYTLMGGEQQVQTTNKIADSFPGVDQYAQAPVVQPPHSHVAVDLRKAPKWLRRPAGASFAFGGKLVSFNSEGRSVNVSQVITEPTLVQRSHNLQQALAAGQMEYLRRSGSDLVWDFVFASLQPDPRGAMRILLGFTPEQLKLNKHVAEVGDISDTEELVDEFAGLNHSPFDTFNMDHDKTFAKVGKNKLKEKLPPFKISTGNDADGIISKALLCGNVELAVRLCVQEGRMTDAVILAAAAGPQILAKTQNKYFKESKSVLSHLIKAVVTDEWDQVVSGCDLSSWAEALAIILTYAKEEDVYILCERLGRRLESEGENDELKKNAEICYVAAGKIGKVVQKRTSGSELSTDNVQELVELVLVAQGGRVGEEEETGQLLTRYAQLLAAQGDLTTALHYLGDSQQEDIAELRERLYVAVGHKPITTGITQPARQQPTANYYQNNPAQRTFGSSFAKPAVQQPNYGMAQPPQPQTQQFPPNNPTYSSSAQRFPPPVGAQSYVPPSQPFPPPGNVNNTQPLFNKPPVSAFTPPTSTNMFNPPASQPLQQMQPYQFNSGVQNIPKPPPPTNAVAPTSIHRSSPSPSPGLSGRSKYLVDPSVGGAPAYNRTSQIAPFNPTVGQSNTYNHLSQPFNAQPAQPYNPVPTQLFNSQQIFNPPSAPAPLASQPAPYNEAKPQVFTPQASTAPGWNDPPLLSGASRAQKKEPTPLQEPITHPLLAGANPNFNQFPPPDGQQQYNPVNQFNAADNYQGYGGYGNIDQGQPPISRLPPMAAAPVEVAKPAELPQPKPPLPEEHMYLQTVFEELRNRCTCSANNPQLRKKLDDVARKLEVLYDALRSAKLSANTLSGLHELVQAVQNGDYTGALHLHTQLVSGPDFSQISSFMPGLKVLIQSALQLGVYLQ